MTSKPIVAVPDAVFDAPGFVTSLEGAPLVQVAPAARQEHSSSNACSRFRGYLVPSAAAGTSQQGIIT